MFSLTTINHNLYSRRGNTGRPSLHGVRKREDDDQDVCLFTDISETASEGKRPDVK